MLAGQTALPSQLLKSEREAKAVRQMVASADQKVDVASGVGEVAVTTVRAASPKEMPGKGVQEEAFLLVPEGSRKADRSGRRQPSKHQPQPDQ